jgi:hypothetical protein
VQAGVALGAEGLPAVGPLALDRLADAPRYALAETRAPRPRRPRPLAPRLRAPRADRPPPATEPTAPVAPQKPDACPTLCPTAVPRRPDAISSVEEIIEDARNGRMFILVDHEDRENEGDLVIPAQMATPDAVNFMATHGRGLICLALTGERIDQLGLPLMAASNQSRHETAFTVSIEAREGVTTGISAHDRARTVAVAIDPEAPARRTSPRPAMCSRCAPARAACWCAPGIPRRRWTSRGWPGSTPRA